MKIPAKAVDSSLVGIFAYITVKVRLYHNLTTFLNLIAEFMPASSTKVVRIIPDFYSFV